MTIVIRRNEVGSDIVPGGYLHFLSLRCDRCKVETSQRLTDGSDFDQRLEELALQRLHDFGEEHDGRYVRQVCGKCREAKP